MLVSYFNQYIACFKEIFTTTKIRKIVKKAERFLILLDSYKFFHLVSFFQPIFSQFTQFFSKLQSVKATANSVNNSFREFREYVEDIKVSYLHEDIRETASEVKHKILIELEKRFFDVDTGHLVAYEVFRKDFYNKLKVSEFKLKDFFL